MSAKVFKAIAALALSACGVVHAAPVTLVAGDSVLFNFDVRGALSPPPYSNTSLNPGLSALLGAQGTTDFYRDLDGARYLFSLDTPGAGIGGGPADFLADGMFSFVVTMTAGSITFDPWFVGSTGTWNSPGYKNSGLQLPTEVRYLVRASDSPTGSVPEPQTLALALLALGATAAVRRKRPA